VTGETIAKQYALVRKNHPEWKAPQAGAALASQWVRAARQYLGLPESEKTGG
jgi:hypothetical protein